MKLLLHFSARCSVLACREDRPHLHWICLLCGEADGRGNCPGCWRWAKARDEARAAQLRRLGLLDPKRRLAA